MRGFVGIVALMAAFMAATGMVADDNGRKLMENKQELDRVKKQLAETKQKVDSLNRLETEIKSSINKYGERVDLNRKLVSRMEQHLKSVRGGLADAGKMLEETEKRLEGTRSSYNALLVDFYCRRRSSADFELWDFDRVFTHGRLVHYLASVSGRSTREMAQAGDSIKLLSQYVDSLEQADSDLDRQRREKKAKINLDMTLKQKEEKTLGSVKRQTDILQDRLVSLSATARQMESIIAELEQAQEKRIEQEGPGPRFQSGSFAMFKGSLRPPIKGKITSTFGWKKDKITNLTSFSPGIDIQPAKGQTGVTASAPGRVVYVGTLRGYEHFVILEHDDGYYTTYAGLSQASVELDELVDTGDVLGACGSGVVHFEIRQGREHLDPVIWLDGYGF